jgi:hypothetical protein
MTHRRPTLALAASAFILLASCGKSSPKSEVGESTAVTPAATTVLTAAPTTEPAAVAPAASAVTAPPTATPTTPTTTTGTPIASTSTGTNQFIVTVGTDSGPNRREKVTKGTLVTISISNPNAADEFHLHGYDLELKAGRGEPATFSFTASEIGTFEIESHATKGVLFVLEVA